MKLDMNKLDLINLEMKCISIVHKLDRNDTEGAKEAALYLHDIIIEQRKLLDNWKELFFIIANKF